MKLSVVLNGAAGSLLGQPIATSIGQVECLFEQAGHQARITAATGPAIVGAIERAVASDADVVVVGGGDGTVATAAGMLIGSDKALGILPLGTLNLLAKDLNIPLDIAEAIPRLARGSIQPMDVGEVNGTIFLSHSVLGLYPLMVQEREEVRETRGLSKWPAMAIATAKALYNYPMLKIGLDLGDGSRRITTPALAVSNNLYEGGFGNFLKRPRLDAGELILYITKHQAPLSMLRLMISLVLGTWKSDTELEVLHVKEFTVNSRRRKLRVANDGEVHRMTPPLNYRIRPGALRVLVPAPEAEAIPAEELRSA